MRDAVRNQKRCNRNRRRTPTQDPSTELGVLGRYEEAVAIAKKVVEGMDPGHELQGVCILSSSTKKTFSNRCSWLASTANKPRFAVCMLQSPWLVVLISDAPLAFGTQT